MHGVAAIDSISGVRLGSIRYEHHSKVQRERVERSFCICGRASGCGGGSMGAGDLMGWNQELASFEW
ncbi:MULTISPECIES: hypothetical protein [Paenibacillus]|uniref:hypothetical protein n=1 Tax=Paenibacillus TaxID=44249 RepID=UPI0011142E10|nr:MULTISPECIES: hypothetical protein [Paenibacillus]